MRSRVVAQITLTAALLTAGIVSFSGQEPPARGKLSPTPATAELSWPLPPSSGAYDHIDGQRLKGYVEELAAISRKSRDSGEKHWGRIAGTASGVETQAWTVEKFKRAGLEVRVEEFPMTPQNFPRSWGLTVTGAGKTLNLTSATPIITFARHMPSPEGNTELDAVWVGLGMASDFAGKDVRGKAVFIYSVPTPSSLIQSSGWMGSIARAKEGGAAAIVLVLALPGNMKVVSHVRGLPSDAKLPVFILGLDDGEAVESLNAASAGTPLKARLQWKIETVTGLKAANVIGVLPGRTDESILMMSHTDGYFEGGSDNAAGTASLIGVAEHFAKVPREQRRRTMYFVATPDHHGGSGGGRLIATSMRDVIAKAAVVVNAEHVTVNEPVWDNAWGSNDRPSLVKTNKTGASWWGVHGSDRLTQIVIKGFAQFGVPTQLAAGGSPGELRCCQWDAPSFYLHNKGVYYHADTDTADVVPASGLRTATQAFAKIFDDINQVDLKDLRPTGSTSMAAAKRPPE